MLCSLFVFLYPVIFILIVRVFVAFYRKHPASHIIAIGGSIVTATTFTGFWILGLHNDYAGIWLLSAIPSTLAIGISIRDFIRAFHRDNDEEPVPVCVTAANDQKWLTSEDFSSLCIFTFSGVSALSISVLFYFILERVF